MCPAIGTQLSRGAYYNYYYNNNSYYYYCDCDGGYGYDCDNDDYDMQWLRLKPFGSRFQV